MTGLVTIAPLVTAPFVGSFLGVVIARLPAGGDIVGGRSRCPQCGATLSPRDLIPFLSWVISAGTCRHCGRPVDVFYPMVEAAALAVALMVAVCVPPVDVAVTVLSLALGWILLTLAWIDVRHLVLPDALTFPLTLLGLAAIAVIAPERFLDHGVAAAAGYLALTAIATAYRLLRGRAGLGGGDAKLMAAAGAWLGIEALPTVLLIASVATLFVHAARMATGGASSAHWSDKLPFGPGLAAAIWIVWLLGPFECRVC